MTSNIPPGIADGTATDDELAEFFGPDLMNQLAAQWRGPEHTKLLFAQWHLAVTKPIGIPVDLAYDLFTGHRTIEDFVAQLGDELLDAFVEKFPGLQSAYQTKLEQEGLEP